MSSHSNHEQPDPSQHLDKDSILDAVINSNNCIDLTDSTNVSIATTPAGSNLLEPLFKPDLGLKRKRKWIDFLVDYGKKADPIAISSSSDEEEEIEVYELEEDEEETEREPEVLAALNNLQFPIDNLFQKTLKIHQIEGLDFMWDRVYKKKQGCLLAHSMGLGKTIQIISLLTTMYQHLKRDPETKFPTGKRVLILAPLVTLTNWEYEFNKWAVNDAGSYIGEVFNITNATHRNYTRIRYLKYWFTNGGVMLLNYDRFRSLLSTSNAINKEEYYRYLVNPGADIVILDEAHRIKNSTSSLSNHVSRIRTRSRICMTGYPLQNHLFEYYYMIDFIAPGLLGSKDDFKAYFGLYIEKCYSDSTKTIKQQAAFKLYVLQLLTGHVTHRRDDLILKRDLPVKTEYLVKFKLSAAQRKGYMNLLNTHQQSPLSGLTILRAMCNHPKIFHSFLLKRHARIRERNLNKIQAEEDDDDFVIDDDNTMEVEEDSSEGGEAYKVIKEALDPDITDEEEEDLFENWAAKDFEWTKHYFDSADIESWKCSGKISFIVDLANECKVIGEKMVLVSHSIACLNYIEQLLPVFGIKSSRLDGSVVALERQKIIDNFNGKKEIGIMLLSAKAAAIGINITAANRIVLIDQDWNPLYDEQSIGRIYRYGQIKPVFVYRLITSSTIEERIYKQSVHKRSISRHVIDNKPTLIISKDELIDYFQEPTEDLELIDLGGELPLNLDWISKSAVMQNKDHITACTELSEEMDPKSVFQLKSLDLRERAKLEALSLLRNWKDGRRFGA